MSGHRILAPSYRTASRLRRLRSIPTVTRRPSLIERIRAFLSL